MTLHTTHYTANVDIDLECRYRFDVDVRGCSDE